MGRRHTKKNEIWVQFPKGVVGVEKKNKKIMKAQGGVSICQKCLNYDMGQMQSLKED